MRRGRITTLAVFFLAIAIAICGNAGITRAFADAMGKVDYICEVHIFQADSMEECRKLCVEMGYKPTDHNLNEGAMEKVPILFDDPAPCVMLGYKTTNDRERSLTGIAVLHMGEGYEMRDFQTVASSLLARNKNLAESMAAAAVEFKTNYDLGAPAAVLSFKLLDLMYVDPLSGHSIKGHTGGKKYGNKESMNTTECKVMLEEVYNGGPPTYDEYDDEHESLAYFILDGKADAEFFAKLITYGTPAIVGAVHKALVSGSAEYQNHYNPETGERETLVWAERLLDGDAKKMIEDGLTTDQWRRFDMAYMDAARDLVTPIQDFATLYLNAKSRGAGSTDFLNQEGIEDLDDLPEQGRELTEKDVDWTYVAAYEVLNKYQYDQDKRLGDWIVEMGQRTYSSDEDYRRLYPLVDVISPSQVTLLSYCGLSAFVSSMSQPDADDPSFKEVYGLIEGRLKRYVEGTSEWRVCVWDGVDNSIYNGTVGLTSDVIRITGANAVMQMNKAEEWQQIKKFLGWYFGLGTGFLTLLQMGLSKFATAYVPALTKAALEIGAIQLAGIWKGIASAAEILGAITFWLWVAEIVISIIAAVAYYLYKEFERPYSDYTKMPTMMFDCRTTKTGPVTIRYNAVWEPLRDRVGDTNAYVGYKWNCLYTTTDYRAGTPMVVQEGMDPFVLKAGDPSTPDGYTPASLFGQKDAANLNSGAYDVKNDQQNYLFYTTEGSIKGAADDLNEGESKDQEGPYIADIVLTTADSAESARANIESMKGEYHLFDHNLGTDEAPVYLGYSLTSKEKDAVRDIRVFAASSDGELSVGQARYLRSGSLPNGDGIYISRDELAGTPIKPSLTLLENKKDVPEGFKPVVFGSDASVYQFGTKEKPYAMYFEPKAESKDQEGLYIADIVLTTADSADRARAKIISKKGKYFLFDRNLGTSEAPVYLGYSLTSIEKDAVRDIRVFAASSDGELSFGQARYSRSGSLPNGDGLYISRSELAGTPIKPNLKLLDNKWDVPEGFEPVVFGSGAPVYLFGSQETPYAMYFEPKVKYTSGDTYVAGIGFITAENLSGTKQPPDNKVRLREGWAAQERIGSFDDVLGQASWQDGVLASNMTSYRKTHAEGRPEVENKNSEDLPFAINMMSGLSFYQSIIGRNTGGTLMSQEYYQIDMGMYMVVAFTHNPHRAIRDVGTYTTTIKNTSQIPATFHKVLTWKKNDVEQTAEAAYVACEEVVSAVTRGLNDLSAPTRGQHAYLTPAARYGLDDVFAEPRNDGSATTWKRSALRLSGLYVLGPVEGIDPLKASDVVVGTQAYDSTNSDGDIGCTLPEESYAVDGTNVSGQEFRSVQDLRFPYNLAAQNLSYPAFTDDEGKSMSNIYKESVQYGIKYVGESDRLYLYLRGKLHKPRYVSGVNVGSYSEAAFKQSNKDADSATLKAMALMADDMAYQGTLATCTEVIPTNLSAGSGEWWATAANKYGAAKDDYGTSTAYLGVTRTDEIAKAVRGLVLIDETVVKTGSAAAATVTVGGNTKYTLPNGSSPFYYGNIDSQALLYYTYNSASQPGCPLTDVTVSSEAFEKSRSTVLFGSATGGDGKIVGRRMTSYIHCATERGRGTYLNGIYLGCGRGLDAALLDLLSQGATEAVVADLNMGNNPVVIGYRTVSFENDQIALHEKTKGTTSDPLRETIRDVVATVGEPLRETLIHDGVVYKPVRDLSLNYNRYAPKIYLYQCMDHYTIAHNRSKDAKGQLIVPSLMGKFQSPITSMGVAYGSRVPYNASADEWVGTEKEPLERWENLLTTRGERIDLNYGVVSPSTSVNIPDRKLFSEHELAKDTLIYSNETMRELADRLSRATDPQYKLTEPAAEEVADNRCYLFFHRADNAVKPGAEIVGGTLKETVERGEVYGYGE